MTLQGAALAGLDNVLDYLSAHVLTCLVPAFLIAGAIMVFIRKDAILKFFGSDVPKYKSYPVASVSGTILAVCSCTILPLFAGIYRRGSGIGPATAFLYSGPAINILAIVYTARVLGLDLGIARAAAAIILSVLVGVTMAFLFGRERSERARAARAVRRRDPPQEGNRPSAAILFFLLVAILVYGTWKMEALPKAIGIAVLSAFVVLHLRSYPRSEISHWLHESWWLTGKIFPALILGTFIVGMVSYFVPPESFTGLFGETTIFSCFLGSVIGAILYMPTLLEVPIIGSTFGYTSGLMAGGPALALLLAGPSVSLPSMLVLHRILGLRKTSVYIFVVVAFSTLAGLLYGSYL